MDMIGYMAYIALIALAVIWTVGVRIRLDAGTHSILGAIFFVVGAIWLGVSGADKFHSLWIIPAGFVFSILASYIGAHASSLYFPFRIIASLFANIVRIGISTEKIRASREAGLKASIDDWASRHEEKK